MPRTYDVTPDVVLYLKIAIAEQRPYREMASRLGVCIDTLKRILQRLGLIDLKSAKYQVSTRSRQKYWTRPCLGCKSGERRAVGLFFCTRCRERQRDMGSFISEHEVH